MEEKNILAGLDLCNDMTQLTCYDAERGEPVAIGRRTGEEGREYQIPTVLAVSKIHGNWLFGSEAEKANKKEYFIFRDFLNQIIAGEKIYYEKNEIDPAYILQRFLVKILSMLKEYYPNNTIKKLVVTVPEKKKSLEDIMRFSLKKMGILSERYKIQSHDQSYIYYSLSQKKELCANNIGLFEMDKEKFFYKQINIDRREKPYIVGISRKDFSESITYSKVMDESCRVETQQIFFDLAQKVLNKQNVTTLYVTGVGFETDWALKPLKELCTGRRIFEGQNLYTKGACYAAVKWDDKEFLKEYLFLDEDMIYCNVMIKTYHKTKMHDHILAKVGMPWQEVNSEIAVIPDEEEELQITIQNVLRHEQKSHLLSLMGFGGRKNKMTRFRIQVRFRSVDECVVTLKDEGFGAFYPSSNRIWEKTIKV